VEIVSSHLISYPLVHTWFVPYQTSPLFAYPTFPFLDLGLPCNLTHVGFVLASLPNSKGYDAILTIIDHGCSLCAIFLPCMTMITGPQIAKLYLNHLYQWFGLPKQVISDRDPHFMSHFSCTLTKELGIQQNLSMVFHPQTDGVRMPCVLGLEWPSASWFPCSRPSSPNPPLAHVLVVLRAA